METKARKSNNLDKASTIAFFILQKSDIPQVVKNDLEFGEDGSTDDITEDAGRIQNIMESDDPGVYLATSLLLA